MGKENLFVQAEKEYHDRKPLATVKKFLAQQVTTARVHASLSLQLVFLCTLRFVSLISD